MAFLRRELRKGAWALLALVLAAPTLAAETTAAAAAAEAPKVKIETSLGDMVVELAPEKAPQTVANFLGYVDSGFYSNTVFHRIIPDFMVQGGGFSSDYRRKPTGEPVQNEADNGLSNRRGTIAMARTSDPHSATAQFFINTVDNRNLDHTSKSTRGWGYTVFGRVVEGLDVLDAIAGTPTGSGSLDGRPARDVPVMPVMINSISRIPVANDQPAVDQPQGAPAAP